MKFSHLTVSSHLSSVSDLQILLIDFKMKVLIAFLVFTVTVYGEYISSKIINELVKDASNACVLELNKDRRFISDGPPTDECLIEDPNFALCVDKKVGVVDQDGTFNFERILSLTVTPEERQRVRESFATKTRLCSSRVVNDACKLIACVYNMDESLCGRVPGEEIGC